METRKWAQWHSQGLDIRCQGADLARQLWQRSAQGGTEKLLRIYFEGKWWEKKKIGEPCCTNGDGSGNPLQYSCLGNPMDRGPWWGSMGHSTGLQRVRHDWVHTYTLCTHTHCAHTHTHKYTSAHTHTHTHECTHTHTHIHIAEEHMLCDFEQGIWPLWSCFFFDKMRIIVHTLVLCYEYYTYENVCKVFGLVLCTEVVNRGIF